MPRLLQSCGALFSSSGTRGQGSAHSLAESSASACWAGCGKLSGFLFFYAHPPVSAASPLDLNVLFSAERTMLSWNRTSLALMAFGFAIERGGLLMGALLPQELPATQLFLFVLIGSIFILGGVATAYFSARQYATLLRKSAPPDLPKHYAAGWGLWVNYSLAGLGMVLMAVLALWHF